MPNSKNNRWLSIVTLILLLANIVTLVLLWTSKKNDDHAGKMPPGRGPAFEFLTKELELDQQQQDAFKKLRDEHQANQKQFQDSIRKAKDALFSLLDQPNVPDTVLQEYSKRATSFDQQMDIITFKHFQQVRALCNPAQQKKFDTIIKDVLSRMAPRPMHGPPPGMKGEGPGELPPPPPGH